MKNVALKPDNMAETIKNIINKHNNDIFVFPTDVVMNSWIDWIITNSDVSAVPLERFIAWDNFKSDFVSAHQEGKTVIPSILRKMFITDLISSNSQRPENIRYSIIFNTDNKSTKEISSFADWVCDIVRSLYFWKCRLIENVPENEWDDEDREYLRLYDDYDKFLNDNKLFEPSWVKDIQFSGENRGFHIFYPELLEDFIDYKDVLSKADNVYFYTMPVKSSDDDKKSAQDNAPEVYLYPDSRKELRQTMLSIVDIVKSGKAQWVDFALSIPDIETYKPYIQREFDLYGIPYVIKAGVSLTKNSAGRIFREIKDCYDTNFSYDSIRTLLLDECVPWQDEVSELKERLIREGNRMRCICSVKNDIWIDAFDRKIENINERITWLKNNSSDNSSSKLKKAEKELADFIELKDFYTKFNNIIVSFFPKSDKGKTFENIRTSWMNFKSEFLKPTKDFSEDANNILSRCIVELNEIIRIEEKYKECGLFINDPFDFYLQELEKKSYTKQTSQTGVNIFPYKLSAAANFKYQFVIDCSQKNLDISYKRLIYLNDEKRDKLKLTDDDNFITLDNGVQENGHKGSYRLRSPKEVFIELYCKSCCSKNNENIIHFSAATETFNGFAIPHNYLKIASSPLPDFDKDDYILNERNLIMKQGIDLSENCGSSVPLLESQINSYNNWILSSISKDNNEYKSNGKIIDAVTEKLITNHKKEADDGKIKITARGSLENFFPCPRKWIFKSILTLSDDSLDTNLMKNYDMGNLNHKILEKFMLLHKGSILPYFDKDKEIFKIKNDDNIIINDPGTDYSKNINKFFYEKGNIVEEAILEPSEFRDSPLVIETLLSQKEKIADNIVSFLRFLLKPYGEGKFVKSSKTFKDFNGIGNCTVYGVEDTLLSVKDNFDYLGKIDCYLLSPNNDWIIIDYKNSKSSIPKEKEIYSDENDILGNFQMTVYRKLVSEKKEKHEVCASYFYSIKDCEKTKATDSLVKETKIQEAEESERVLDDYAQLFVNCVKNNMFKPHTSSDKSDKLRVISYKDCKDCPYKTVCRTTYNIAGKELPNK